jgi:NADPH:quinone reductase-like Zn-dependent oxidoreductase
VKAGEAVSRFHSDDRVMTQFFPQWIEGADGRDSVVPLESPTSLGGRLPGVLAQHVVMHEDALVRVPRHLSDEEAATLPIAGLTAWRALVDHGQLQAGQSVLVMGTGGVALFAVQIAHALGAKVIVLSSSDAKLARVRDLGGDVGINYVRHPRWSEQVQQATAERGVDHVVDVAGGAMLAQALDALAIDGRIAVIGYVDADKATLPIVPIILKRARIGGVSVGPRRSLEALGAFIETHELKPVIERVYPFSQVPDAFAHLRRGAFGKVVVRVAGT